MKHADVIAALDLVVEEVAKESRRIYKAGSDAMLERKLDLAQKAIDFAKNLKEFEDRVKVLGEAWKELQKQMEGAAPEVKEIVLPTKLQKSRKTGYTRKAPETIAKKSTFTVSFADGTVISDKYAKVVFGRAIEKIGAAAVAQLGVVLGGEPLVSRDKGAFKKHPTQVQPISSGWFVKTHSSTKQKIQLLNGIAKKLKQKLNTEIVR